MGQATWLDPPHKTVVCSVELRMTVVLAETPWVTLGQLMNWRAAALASEWSSLDLRELLSRALRFPRSSTELLLRLPLPTLVRLWAAADSRGR